MVKNEKKVKKDQVEEKPLKVVKKSTYSKKKKIKKKYFKWYCLCTINF